MTINFLLNSVLDAHALKRVNDFKAAGCNVRVHGFLRAEEKKRPTDSNVHVIGTFSNNLSYRKRLSIYAKSIKRLFRENNGKDEVWYYLGLDVAMFAILLGPHRRFVYEECDLVQTYLSSSFMQKVFEKLDKYIICHALVAIFTSEGFLDYHYGSCNLRPNMMIVPNKLSPAVKDAGGMSHAASRGKHLRFAFVGGIRYQSLLSIANLISKNFPSHEFHFYGFLSPTIPEEQLPHHPNLFYHGRFKSPDDLPRIYDQTDVLVCTYDTKKKNVCYAEPNKLYEAIWFRRPIVVSKGTFLADKVSKLKIGFSVNPFDEEDVVKVVGKCERFLASADSLRIWDSLDINPIDNIDYVETILNRIQ